MNIAEIKKRKAQLEHDIAEKIMSFHEVTGTVISKINYKSTGLNLDGSKNGLMMIRFDVEI